ncbi:ditrans [Mactra antiquata]
MPVIENVDSEKTLLLAKKAMNTFILRIIHYVILIGTYVRQWLIHIPMLSFSKPDNLTLQADARQLKKLPLHLGMIILENDISYSDLANVILWSAAMGISFISIYDTNGIVKRNDVRLSEEIKKQKSFNSDTDYSKSDIQLHSNLEKNTNKSTSQVDVYLLCLKDGRQSIVNMTKYICSHVKQKQIKSMDISPQSVDCLFQEETGYPDPDMVLKFGQVDSLLGFMPWHVRLTEILSLPTHIGVDYKTFRSVMISFGDTEQRFGK